MNGSIAKSMTALVSIGIIAALGFNARAAIIDIPVGNQTYDAFSSDSHPNDDDDVNGLGGNWKFVYENTTTLPEHPGGTITLGGVDYELDYGAEVSGSTD